MGWVVNAMPRPIYPRERDPVTIVQVVGGRGGRTILDGHGRFRLPPGFDPRTVQTAASMYTD
jgi:hypothetical protein